MTESRTEEPAKKTRGGVRRAGEEASKRRRRRRLPLPVRIFLWALSGLVILLGIAGLVLPGLQGILLLILGAALLSLASETVHGWLESFFAERFPERWKRLEQFRTRVHWRFRRRDRRRPDAAGRDDDAPG